MNNPGQRKQTVVSNKRFKNYYSKEFDMNSIPDVGSYFVTLQRKGEPEDTQGIKGQLVLKQRSEPRH